jgi:AcrR family transcriptional regulator
MGDMSRGTRQESRERIEAAILDAARAQLAEVGAAGLSLRLIAREVGMVSSAIYRYVASRDDLLTRLIVDAYNALGDAVESAVRASAGSSDADRWLTGARAIRRWSLANTHEYLLLYGTPVPGYAAPTDTIDPGTRVLFALALIVREAAEGKRLADAPGVATTKGLSADLTQVAKLAGIEARASAVLGFINAWTQMFGLITFELTNQTRGITTSHGALFDATVRQNASLIGLTSQDWSL